MDDLQAVERRSRNVGVVRGIVFTMRALSAIQFRKGAAALERLREYEAGLRETLALLPPPRLAPDAGSRVLLVAMGGDQGLSGPLTRRLVAHTLERAREVDGVHGGIFAVGRRLRESLEDAGAELLGWRRAPLSPIGIDGVVGATATVIERAVATGGWSAVELVYARSGGVGRFTPARFRLFPPDLERARPDGSPPGHPPRTYEPARRVAASVLEEWVYVGVFRAALETFVSDHGARLQVTDGAVRALDRKLEELQTERNRIRQHAITEEIQEIVSGAEETRAGGSTTPFSGV